MNEFKIMTLTSLEDSSFIEEFISFPFHSRRGPFDQGLIPPQQTKRLLAWGFQHGSVFWLVKNQSNEIILRLSLRCCPDIKDHGTIGFFEIDLQSSLYDEAFRFTMTKVETWFREKKIKHIVAPIDLNTWFPYRFSLDGKKFFPRFKWEPTNPPEFLQLFIKQHFFYFSHFNSVFFPHIRIGAFVPGAGHLQRSYKKLNKLGYSLRPFDRENFKTKELPVFYEISHEAFREALLFEPIDLETFSELYAGAIASYDFSPSCVLIDPQGETAGFLFAFFDGDYLIIKSIALKKKYQGLKLSSGMIYSAVKMGFEQNKKGTVSALVRTGLTSEKIAGKSQKWSWFSWTHDYVLVKKDLDHE
jgi:hypothetical protein